MPCASPATANVTMSSCAIHRLTALRFRRHEKQKFVSTLTEERKGEKKVPRCLKINSEISLLSLLFPLSLPLFVFSTPLSLSSYNTRYCNTLRECLGLLGNQQLGNRKSPSLQFLSLQPLCFRSLWNTMSSPVLLLPSLITPALSAWIPFQAAGNVLWISFSTSDPIM